MAISNNSTGLRPGVCTSTTRPTNPYEGFMIYETDTDMVAIWNGTAWRYISATTPTNGTVLQIVSNTYATQLSSTSATFVDAGLTATITPKSTSSKVLVIYSQGTWATAATTGLSLSILRGVTVLRNTIDLGYGSSSGVGSYSTFLEFDSPNTTSAVTYKTQFNRNSGAGIVYINTVNTSTTATIYLIEVAG
jgi:hypothetical protein